MDKKVIFQEVGYEKRELYSQTLYDTSAQEIHEFINWLCGEDFAHMPAPIVEYTPDTVFVKFFI